MKQTQNIWENLILHGLVPIMPMGCYILLMVVVVFGSETIEKSIALVYTQI